MSADRQGECQHKWEDAQLRATRDGVYIQSVDFCGLCGMHDFSARITSLEAELQDSGAYYKATIDRLEAELEEARKQLRVVVEILAPEDDQPEYVRVAYGVVSDALSRLSSTGGGQ